MDESAAFFGLDEAHFAGAAGAWGSDLEAPLFAEEEGEGADVGVLLVADFLGAGNFGGEVVHHG